MRSLFDISRLVPLILTMLVSVPAQASFEVEPRTSSERAAATHTALGLLEGSFHLPYLDCADSLRPMAVALHGFRPFGMEDLRFEAIWARLSLGGPGDGVCISYQRFGALSYLEETYLVGYGLRCGNIWFQPGIRFGVARLEDRWIDSATLIDFAFSVRIRPGIKVSVVADNLLAGAPIRAGAPCPTRLRFGLGHLVSRHLAWGLEVAKDAGHPTCIAAGVEGRVMNGIMLRSGLRSDPQEFGLGLGLAVKGMRIDVSTSLNLDLGPTHAVGVTYLRY